MFDQHLREQVRNRYEREEQLHTALERNELVANFQIDVDLRSGRTVGADALCRWVYPTEGTLAPADSFLDVIEDIGAMHEFADRMREAALRELALVRRRPELEASWVSVNPSASDLVSSARVFSATCKAMASRPARCASRRRSRPSSPTRTLQRRSCETCADEALRSRSSTTSVRAARHYRTSTASHTTSSRATKSSSTAC